MTPAVARTTSQRTRPSYLVCAVEQHTEYGLGSACVLDNLSTTHVRGQNSTIFLNTCVREILDSNTNNHGHFSSSLFGIFNDSLIATAIAYRWMPEESKRFGKRHGKQVTTHGYTYGYTYANDSPDVQKKDQARFVSRSCVARPLPSI